MAKLTKIGNSHGVVIPSATMLQANLHPDDQVVLAPLQDAVLVVAEGSAAGRMVSAMMNAMDNYSDTYRLLASEQLSDNG